MTPNAPEREAPQPRICIVPFELIQPVALEWLWDGRIPRGKLCVVAGDPGLGKSYLTLYMAAVLSRGGEWPDGSRAARENVLIVSAEDDAADTIRPRLDRLGADPARIWNIEGVKNDGPDIMRPFSLRMDLALLSEAITDTAAAMVIVDPLNAFLGGIDSHKAAEVRGVLSPLAHVAGETRASLVCVHHLNKGTSANALYRASGSLDFVAAARIVHGVAPDPDLEGRRVFVPVKCNIAKMPDGLGFRIGEDGITFDKLPVTLDAAAAFTSRPVDHEERSERDMAKDFILAELADGPVPVTAMYKVAKDNGYSQITVRRAGSDLHVKKTKEGYQGTWHWSLPAHPDGPKVIKESKDAHVSDVSTFDTFEPDEASALITFEPPDHLWKDGDGDGDASGD